MRKRRRSRWPSGEEETNGTLVCRDRCWEVGARTGRRRVRPRWEGERNPFRRLAHELPLVRRKKGREGGKMRKTNAGGMGGGRVLRGSAWMQELSERMGEWGRAELIAGDE